ncbi:RrF2 family transcriptional regulator [Lolliginicoccus suaedae]|uniref:RrF2 family transcriptional regulator n=1 Tax=Lolliginicoccus suaedae TaxID=2605429 RepID=UPI0011EE8C12|nr:Rrf2 family transcriptional regulator [Lolliginicoccus suaedae]
MQLTQFTDLGLRIVMRLAVAPPAQGAPARGTPAQATASSAPSHPSTRVVAADMNISYAHATKVVARLSELGVVAAQRGRGGGLMITDLGREARIGWLARKLEGDGEVVTCEGDKPCPLRHGCQLRRALRDAQEAFYAALDAHTVGDLALPPARAILLSLSRRPTEPVNTGTYPLQQEG